MKKLNVLNNDAAAEAGSPPRPDAPTPAPRGSGYWRSLEDKLRTHDEKADSWKEFPDGAEELEVPADGVSRRRFFGLVGSGAALAGMSAATTGCIRKPKEHILPYTQRPEDLIPGKPMQYATAFAYGGTVEGVLVESHDGRPIKVEGNPQHPGSLGGTGVFAQASILDLYDPDRSRRPREGTTALDDWAVAKAGADGIVKGIKAQGAGVALVTPHITSPAMKAQLKAFARRYPKARIFESDPAAPTHANAAAELVAGNGARFRYVVDGVKIVFALDSDFLCREQDSTRLAKEWSWGRRIVGPTDRMSRLYAVEPHLTGTGTMADHRSRVKASQVGDVLIALLKELVARNATVAKGNEGKAEGEQAPQFQLPAGVDVGAFPAVQLPEDTMALVKAAAGDLLEAMPGPDEEDEPPPKDGRRPRYRPLRRSTIVVGERQPTWVHALGLLINTALGNVPKTVQWRTDADAVKAESLAVLAADLGGKIKTVLCFDCNPVYDAPAELGLGEKLAAAVTLHAGMYFNETAAVSDWHLPLAHYLECWGDQEASDGTVTICQPLIEPLFDAYAPIEMLGYFATGKLDFDDILIKKHWRRESGRNFSDRTWRKWLHDGRKDGSPAAPNQPAPDFSKLAASMKSGRTPVAGTEINFHLCPTLLDGRYANNGWLQELPHPLTKITWDNAAYMSPATAAGLKVGNQDMVTVQVGQASLDLPVFIAPGQADNTVSITLGGGRTVTRDDGQLGVVSEGAGFNANLVRLAAAPWFAEGSVAAKGGTYPIANTQDYGSMKPPVYQGIEYPERPIVLEASVEEFNQDPNFVERANLMPQSRLKHLWTPPTLTGKQQWGMSIDLNTCTGCLTCVVACQAENNIPVVGKERVIDGREMHWIRIDRYYRGDENNPTAVVQPMACQQCESAPCETVCPVAATTHSPEGLNDMAYNRCIGTRYCSNNCPYKVRRFNFFNYNLELRPGGYEVYRPNDEVRKEDQAGDDGWLRQMQLNPDVTVRFRGVMEKCTYCTQRISQAKIEAHVAGKDLVEDGKIVTACQQACPTGSIVFGDTRDPDSAVSKAKRSPRDYSVLRDLNTGPRTTYLARIRNPHPELV